MQPLDFVKSLYGTKKSRILSEHGLIQSEFKKKNPSIGYKNSS